MFDPSDLFDLSHTEAKSYLEGFEYPWEALGGIGEMIVKIAKSLDKKRYYSLMDGVYIHKNAVVAPSAYIGAPCIIGENSEVRHCAFIRGNVLIGKNCVIGNSTEVKNSILFDGVQIPHYNYVGDSILGYKAHLGAGAITSNVKSDKTGIKIKVMDKTVETGRKKIGALVGDFVEVGCGSVLNPGTIIMRNSNIYPLTSVRGFVPANSIVKAAGVITAKL